MASESQNVGGGLSSINRKGSGNLAITEGGSSQSSNSDNTQKMMDRFRHPSHLLRQISALTMSRVDEAEEFK